MTPSAHIPAVSVIVPTFQRPDLLPRAIDSVLAQSFADFELIICDDEDPPGESRLIAQRYAAADPRIRVAPNAGPRGQVGNFNHGLRLARAPWIKPLHDDDALDPRCLERLLDAASLAGGRAAVVRCLAARHGASKRPDTEPRGTRAIIEELTPRLALLAMYLQDVDDCTPSQVLVAKRAVDAGAVMPDIPGLVSNVDSAWTLDLIAHGSLVLLNETLVHQYLGGGDRHDSITSRIDDDALDAEFALLREIQFARIDPVLRPPSPDRIKAMIRAIRAMHRVRRARPIDAAALAATVRSRAAWSLAIRWALRRSFPGRFEIVPRQPLIAPAAPRAAQRRRAAG